MGNRFYDDIISIIRLSEAILTNAKASLIFSVAIIPKILIAQSGFCFKKRMIRLTSELI